MRLWLRDSERRPDPPPLKTDDRAAVVTGLALWVIATVLAIVFSAQLSASGLGWIVPTTVVGVALGIVGLVYTFVKSRRTSRR